MVNSNQCVIGNSITLNKELVVIGCGEGVGKSSRIRDYMQERIRNGGHGILTTRRKVSPEAVFAIMYGAGNARVGAILLEESEEELSKRLDKQLQPRLQLLADEAEATENDDV